MEEDRKITIDESLSNSLDGKCFIDYEQSNRIELFRFEKTDKGLMCHFIGCDYTWGYDFKMESEYGEFDAGDVGFSDYVFMLEDKFPWFEETTMEKFDLGYEIVKRQMALHDKLFNDFENIQTQFFMKGKEE